MVLFHFCFADGRQFWVTPMQFYKDAIRLMKTKLSRNKARLEFFVFSDDIEYAKEHLMEKHQKFNKPGNLQISSENNFNVNFVSSGEISSLEDFFLMTICSHMIVSNSTFSWWAAYLIQNEGKIVIGPKFHPKFFDHYETEEKRAFKRMVIDQKWYPPNWIIINPHTNTTH
jgi:hypothetical protein